VPSAIVVFIASLSTASAKSLKVSFAACARCFNKSSNASRVSAADSPWNNDFIYLAQQQMLRRISTQKDFTKKTANANIKIERDP
jgi:hypothetical protein